MLVVTVRNNSSKPLFKFVEQSVGVCNCILNVEIINALVGCDVRKMSVVFCRKPRDGH